MDDELLLHKFMIEVEMNRVKVFVNNTHVCQWIAYDLKIHTQWDLFE